MIRVLLSALALTWVAPGHAEAEYLGTFVWSGQGDRFGGFSAIEVDATGTGFTVLSDRVRLISGRFLRDGEGRIAGIDADPADLLRDVDGNPLRGVRADSEGLAIAPDGTFYISFEGLARVRRQAGATGHPALLPGHPDFAAMQPNAALEALAIAPDGALYAIPERSGRADRPFPVYRFERGAWTVPFHLPRRGPFLVVGANIGPDGRLYVLERDFLGFAFRSRVRRFALDGSGEETVIETPAGRHGNLEGIAVWQDGQGLRLTMIADDNFNALQATEIVEYRIPG